MSGAALVHAPIKTIDVSRPPAAKRLAAFFSGLGDVAFAGLLVLLFPLGLIAAAAPFAALWWAIKATVRLF